MERRLAQRAENQKAEDIEAKKSGTPPPENLERGVMGRELAGLGIETASAVIVSKPDVSEEPEPMDLTADAEEVAEAPKKIE